MDIGFEILIPIESKKSLIKFEQPVYEWKGEKYPQGQEQAQIYYFKLRKSIVPKHILSFLPDNLQKDNWQCISIIEGIDTFVEELSVEKEVVKSEDKLFNLLTLLIGSENRWVLNFEPDYDRLDETMEGNIDLAFHKIINSLKVEKNGFVIWFDKSEKLI